MSTPQRYQLDYGWGHDPAWSEDATVTLRVSVVSDHPRESVEAVAEWLETKHWGTVKVAGDLELGWFEGGGYFQVVGGAARAESPLVLLIISGGQDAFDSIHWYAEELYNELVAIDPDIRIEWEQLPHRS
ncbi:hypothetical protein [Janibacter sp. GXQ6167]|uniref:hypothetical protein n=1 Tax=Janibacter sp. GXQ6167 TaxID=3240791 RepID=UPI0035242FA0